jgi:hypothetical protein
LLDLVEMRRLIRFILQPGTRWKGLRFHLFALSDPFQVMTLEHDVTL